MAVKEEDGFLSILVKKNKEAGFEGTITDLKLDIVLGHLENILEELPDI